MVDIQVGQKRWVSWSMSRAGGGGQGDALQSRRGAGLHGSQGMDVPWSGAAGTSLHLASILGPWQGRSGCISAGAEPTGQSPALRIWLGSYQLSPRGQALPGNDAVRGVRVPANCYGSHQMEAISEGEEGTAARRPGRVRRPTGNHGGASKIKTVGPVQTLINCKPQPLRNK